MIWAALFLLLILCFVRYVEGFNPYLPDTRTEDYPDQSAFLDLIIAEKYVMKQIGQTDEKDKKREHLLDLLNLLQFI